MPLKSKKKNVLFLKIGPPAVTPKSLRVGVRLRQAGGIGEEIVGVEIVVAEEFEQFAVVLVGSRSRHHVDDGAAAIAKLGAEIACWILNSSIASTGGT